MSFASFLIDECTIQNRSVTATGMTDTEAFTAQAPTACRVLKNTASLFNAEKAQHATVIRTRVVLPVDAIIGIRDRISHEGRLYQVVEVIEPFGARAKHHKIAVCEAISGEV